MGARSAGVCRNGIPGCLRKICVLGQVYAAAIALRSNNSGSGPSGVTLPQLASIVTCYAVIRRVIHAWFRTPRGNNRSGPGDSAGSIVRTASGLRCVEGRGMVRPLEAFRVAGLPNDVGAEIGDFDLKKYSLAQVLECAAQNQEVPGPRHPARGRGGATGGGGCRA